MIAHPRRQPHRLQRTSTTTLAEPCPHHSPACAPIPTEVREASCRQAAECTRTESLHTARSAPWRAGSIVNSLSLRRGRLAFQSVHAVACMMIRLGPTSYNPAGPVLPGLRPADAHIPFCSLYNHVRSSTPCDLRDRRLKASHLRGSSPLARNDLMLLIVVARSTHRKCPAQRLARFAIRAWPRIGTYDLHAIFRLFVESGGGRSGGLTARHGRRDAEGEEAPNAIVGADGIGSGSIATST
jgi:hypothetical protein